MWLIIHFSITNFILVNIEINILQIQTILMKDSDLIASPKMSLPEVADFDPRLSREAAWVCSEGRLLVAAYACFEYKQGESTVFEQIRLLCAFRVVYV